MWEGIRPPANRRKSHGKVREGLHRRHADIRDGSRLFRGHLGHGQGEARRALGLVEVYTFTEEEKSLASLVDGREVRRTIKAVNRPPPFTAA